jgi:hypothetical protein
MPQPERAETLVLGSGKGRHVFGLAYGAIRAAYCRRGAPLLPQHQLPSNHERDLARKRFDLSRSSFSAGQSGRC